MINTVKFTFAHINSSFEKYQLNITQRRTR
nr:MAG TPA: hypothetical protein [Caudoviricetes sp.]